MRPGPPPRAAPPRRADRGHRSAAAGAVLGLLPSHGGRGHDAHRRGPRHGRGRPLPAPRPDPVRPIARRGLTGRDPLAGRVAEPRGSLPRAGGEEGLMSGHRVRAITRRLLQGFRRDRRTVALLFVAPIVILGLLGYLIRGSSSVPEVGIANQDSGPVGALVADALGRSTMIKAKTISQTDGDTRLKDGSLVAYIVFPSNFSQQAQAG